MKRNSVPAVISLVSAAFLTFASCSLTPPAAPTVADQAIFDLPLSMTGLSMRSARAILPGTRDTIDTFFDYGRAQMYVACQWAAEVKAMISAVEAAGVFEREADWIVKMTSGVAANDIFRWTVLGGDAYKLEWWQVQLDGTSYQKYLQIDLSYFSRAGDVITVRGKVSAHPSADPTATLWTHYARMPEWVMIEFDSAKQSEAGKRWMKISVSGFQHEELDPSVPPVSNATDYQECIFEATRDATGLVALTGVSSVPGVNMLTYLDEYEYRYYIYKAKGNSSKATVSLAMPLSADYAAATGNLDTVFTLEKNTVGGIATEYAADLLRADGTFGIYSGWAVLDLLLLSAYAPYENSTPSPTTATIASAIELAYAGNPTHEGLENLNYMINVSNPVYLLDAGYSSFGPSTPSGFPTEAELPAFSVEKATLDGLPAVLGNPANTFDPNEAAPTP